MSKTIIPGGWVKIEIGDDSSENHALGELTAGFVPKTKKAHIAVSLSR
jgi:hypothetical protein